MASQIRLSHTGEDTSIRVTWRTLSESCRSIVRYQRVVLSASQKRTTELKAEDGRLGYSLSCIVFSCVANADSSLFQLHQGCSTSRKSEGTYYMHSAVLRKLVPGRRKYWYRIESEEFQSKKIVFHSPRYSSPSSTLKFLVFGDMGAPSARKCPGARGTILALGKDTHETDIIFHVGDISYADGKTLVWNDFMDAIESFACSVPYMIGIGNHDYDWVPDIDANVDDRQKVLKDASGLTNPFLPEWGNFGSDSNGECGYPTFNRFLMPNDNSGSGKPPFWYGFHSGPVHFVIISAEHDLREGSPQRIWLENELSTIDRCIHPWLIVMMHRPLYVAYPHKSNRKVGRHLANILEDLLLENEVDILISGHIHSYYRSCISVRHGKCVKSGGISHFTIGSGGKKISHVEELGDQPEWLAESKMKHGYGRVLVNGNQNLTFEFIGTKDGGMEVLDTITIPAAQMESSCKGK